MEVAALEYRPDTLKLEYRAAIAKVAMWTLQRVEAGHNVAKAAITRKVKAVVEQLPDDDLRRLEKLSGSDLRWLRFWRLPAVKRVKLVEQEVEGILEIAEYAGDPAMVAKEEGVRRLMLGEVIEYYRTWLPADWQPEPVEPPKPKVEDLPLAPKKVERKLVPGSFAHQGGQLERGQTVWALVYKRGRTDVLKQAKCKVVKVIRKGAMVEITKTGKRVKADRSMLFDHVPKCKAGKWS
jgi:hypothetical protein